MTLACKSACDATKHCEDQWMLQKSIELGLGISFGFGRGVLSVNRLLQAHKRGLQILKIAVSDLDAR
ncbi:hypothetical protein BB780_20455 [Stenotrophomonas maltophilia]|nr:hypothetical protein BB780_20455 [Stenotrophomonas maltophilia]